MSQSLAFVVFFSGSLLRLWLC